MAYENTPEGEQIAIDEETMTMCGSFSNELAIPDRRELMAAIPSHCFHINERIAFTRLACALLMTIGIGASAHVAFPKVWAFTPWWIAYAAVNGTVATGLWVLAHECGHRAFSRRKPLETAIGFILHSALLVPYFTWRKSHAWHHARTNHLTEGETHVPPIILTSNGRYWDDMRARMGQAYGALIIAGNLLIGWFVYASVGAISTSERRRTSHLWPFATRLSPGTWRAICSIGGLACTIALLVWWAIRDGWVAPALAYGGPYLVVNAWVVAYTWLHHTDVDVPHLGAKDWTWIEGAFLTVDRRYGRLIDYLHCNIGSTHVVHHLFPRIPHYHAAQATRSIATAFPHLYRYDDTPVPVALWRVATRCVVLKRVEGDTWYF
jgi:fatty acid desaturase